MKNLSDEIRASADPRNIPAWAYLDEPPRDKGIHLTDAQRAAYRVASPRERVRMLASPDDEAGQHNLAAASREDVALLVDHQKAGHVAPFGDFGRRCLQLMTEQDISFSQAYQRLAGEEAER